MKTKTLLVAAIAALAIVMPTLSRAQGFVSTVISSNQVAYYRTLVASSAIGSVNTEGLAGFPATALGYNAGATSTSITFSNASGLTSLGVYVQSGQFGSAGQSVNDTVAQSGPFLGIVVALFDPSQPSGSAAGFASLSIDGAPATGFPTTVNSPYSAYYYQFSSPQSQFYLSGQLNNTLGSGARAEIFGVQAVPEPATISLIASTIGGFGLLRLFRGKK